jgi:hypothetical protein
VRQISFALTTAQVRNRTKTVTRRVGWDVLEPGMLLQPVVKGQGLKKGERAEKIGGPIRVVTVRREYLDRLIVNQIYGADEMRREGFPDEKPEWFVDYFAVSHHCKPHAWVTRIEFEYT